MEVDADVAGAVLAVQEHADPAAGGHLGPEGIGEEILAVLVVPVERYRDGQEFRGGGGGGFQTAFPCERQVDVDLGTLVHGEGLDRDLGAGFPGIGRDDDAPAFRGAACARPDLDPAAREAEHAHAGRVLAGLDGLVPAGAAKAYEDGGIGDADTVIADGERRMAGEIEGLDRDVGGAGTARILKKFVQDVADGAVEQAGDLGDRLAADRRSDGCGKAHGNDSGCGPRQSPPATARPSLPSAGRGVAGFQSSPR